MSYDFVAGGFYCPEEYEMGTNGRVARVARTVRSLPTMLERLIVTLEHRYTPIARFQPGPFEGWGFLWQPALLGFLALSLIFAGSCFTESPFKLEMPNTWFFGVPQSAAAALLPANETRLIFSIVLTYGGLILLLRVWLRLAEVVKLHHGASDLSLSLIAALWSVPMLIAPPLFSRDVFSYAAQGEMTAHGLSPYVMGPFSLGSSPYVNPVDPLWGNTPAPYGPLFLHLDGLIVRSTHHHQLLSTVGLRLLEVGAVALLALVLPRMARALGRDGGEAIVLGVLNPLVILTLIGGAHNDAIMVALLCTGLMFALRRRLWLALIFCALAAAIKAPAALGLVYVAWTWLSPRLEERNLTVRTLPKQLWQMVSYRIRPIVLSVILATITLLICTKLAGFGFGWIKNLATPGTVRSWVAPATGLGMAITGLCHLIGFDVSMGPILSVTRLMGLMGAMSAAVYLLWRAQSRGWVRSLGMSLLLFVVLGPVVQPWYLVWGLVVLAASYQGREHFWLLALSITTPFLGLPGAQDLWRSLLHANPLLMAVALVILLGTLLVPLGRWTQWSWPEVDDRRARLGLAAETATA